MARAGGSGVQFEILGTMPPLPQTVHRDPADAPRADDRLAGLASATEAIARAGTPAAVTAALVAAASRLVGGSVAFHAQDAAADDPAAGHLALPLRVADRTLGTLVLVRGAGYSDADVAIARALAACAGAALASSAPVPATPSDPPDRGQALADAARAFAESGLDFDVVAAGVVRQVAEAVGDVCVLSLVSEDGQSIVPRAFAHRDPSRHDGLAPLITPRSVDGESPLARCLREDRPLHVGADSPGVQADSREFLRRTQASAVVVPLREGGRPVGTLGLSRDGGRDYSAEDITFLEALAHTASLALQNARLFRRAEEANRLKDEFLGTLSHELRTPLNAILGWASLLRGGLDPSRHAHAHEVIERNARLQAQVVNDLLDVASLLRGQVRLRLDSSVRPMDALQRALEAVRPSAENRGVRTTASGDPAVAVRADAVRLQQVFWNLLANAVKFTPRGGSVDATVRAEGDTVVVEVRDTGVGIPLDFLPHVFERFRQAEVGTTRRHPGMGLGLTIVRQLVEAHGGTVSVSSDGPDQGATFAVRLPLHHAEPVAHLSVVPTRLASVSLARLRSRVVLVVDDDADTREVAGAALAAAGAHFLHAESVDEALDILEHTPADVVVSDLEMPGQDGFAVLPRGTTATEYGTTVAELLGDSVNSVNSALQRARAGMREHLPAQRQDWTGGAEDAQTRELVRRFTDATVATDLDRITSMLRDDVAVAGRMSQREG